MAIDGVRLQGWMGRLSLLALGMAVAGISVAAAADTATPTQRPWLDPALSPDQRASALVKAMTPAEKFRLIHSDYGASMSPDRPSPEGGKNNAAFIPAMPRLGLPAIQETDAGTGVALQHAYGDGNTALPSGLSTASSFDPAIAKAGGAMIGSEAHKQGFNVMLAGGVNLMRDPRNGRNFEYAGEDPLLAGTIVGAAVQRHRERPRGVHREALRTQRPGNQPQRHRRPARPHGSARIGSAGLPDRHRNRSPRLGDVFLQPGRQCLCLRERLAAQPGAQARLEVSGLRDVRLGRGAQHGGGSASRAGSGIGWRRAGLRQAGILRQAAAGRRGSGQGAAIAHRRHGASHCAQPVCRRRGAVPGERRPHRLHTPTR